MKPATLLVDYRGNKIGIAEAIIASGSTLKHPTVRHRVFKLGWDLERALTTPATSGKFGACTTWAARRARALQIYGMIDQGMSYNQIGAYLGLSRNAIAGIVLRYKRGDCDGRQVKLVERPLDQPARIDYGNPICWASGCTSVRHQGSKFCERHSFKPRTDQPMSRLMAARA